MRGRAERLRLCILIFNPHLDMNVDHNARLTPRGREAVVRRITADHLPARLVAAEAGVSERTVRKWLARFRCEGSVDLKIALRSHVEARSRRLPRRSPWSSLFVGCASQVSRSRVSAASPRRRSRGSCVTTVSTALRCSILLRPRVATNERPPVNLFTSISKSSPASSGPATASRAIAAMKSGARDGNMSMSQSTMLPRIAFARIMPDEGQHSAIKFLHAALAYFRSLGLEVKSIMTDNGACYLSKLLAQACRAAALSHLFTPPLHSSHQWQGRTLHPDFAARMGLCPFVSALHRARCSFAFFPSPLQLAPTSLGSRPPPANLKTQTDHEQPLEPSHLDIARSAS